jgi:hypothetical protein
LLLRPRGNRLAGPLAGAFWIDKKTGKRLYSTEDARFSCSLNFRDLAIAVSTYLMPRKSNLR